MTEETQNVSCIMARNSSMPSVNKKYHFDSTQTSPALNEYIGIGRPVIHKKTISFSSFHIPDKSPEKLAEDYDFLNSRSYNKRDSNKVFRRSVKSRIISKLPNLKKDQMLKKDHKEDWKLGMVKIGEMDQYSCLNDDIKNKFKEFIAVRNVLNSNKDLKFPANERYKEYKDLTDNLKGYNRKFMDWNSYFNEIEQKSIIFNIKSN